MSKLDGDMKRILVVDDKPNVRTSLRIGLRRQGYEVDVADDATKALHKVAQKSYDVLLSDVRMPDIDGFVLAAKVAESQPNIRIVLMSAYDFKDFQDQHQKLDGVPKISKPFEMEQLVSVLENVLAGES